LSKDAEDAKKLQNWRKGGQRAGSNAGNFPFVAAEVLYRRQKTASGGLKKGDMNRFLDRLAAAKDSKEKTAVLAELINRTNVQEMRWIIMIILKELKLGISEKTVFSVFHPDAEDLFNVTCDLKLVCEKLCDRNQRYKRQDIEVGKAVRPQLAARVGNVEEAWKKVVFASTFSSACPVLSSN
jgi:DNA ligase-4